ncbi:MAG: CAP domain-containing protein [Akkermansiaceae bacterium]|jgi:uncharacterized protein YkwD
MRIFLIALILLSFSVGAQSAELSDAFMEKAFAAMKSSDQGKRKSAYRTFQHLGPESMPGYRIVLQKAKLHHQGAMRRAMAVRGNPYTAHSRLSDEVGTERERVMGLIHTDWKKNPAKINMLRNELEGIGRKYKTLIKLVGSNTQSIDENMATAFAALVEIEWELASIERSEDGDNTYDLPDNDELEDAVYEDSFEAGEWKEQKDKWKMTQKSEATVEAAHKHNSDCQWAKANQRAFSNNLNDERAVMGLHPLLLEERLSAAAWGHSNDMKAGGFFSHTSPVKGKKSPADRARKAKFQGRWTGENIFMGSPSFMSAYNGWFGSDGHRFIMFTKGASNVVGMGIDGGHWTMMTGRK